jgi:hypothetical protein
MSCPTEQLAMAERHDNNLVHWAAHYKVDGYSIVHFPGDLLDNPAGDGIGKLRNLTWSRMSILLGFLHLYLMP